MTKTYIHEPERFPSRAFDKLAAADPVYQRLFEEAEECSKGVFEQLDDPAIPDFLFLETVLDGIRARAAVLGYGLGTTLSDGMNKIVGQLLGLGFKAMEVVERHEGPDSDEYKKMSKLVGKIMMHGLMNHFQQYPCVVFDEEDVKPDCGDD